MSAVRTAAPAATKQRLILTVYEFLIRRVNAVRWLFGMKPRQRLPGEDRNGKASLAEARPAQTETHAFTG